MDLRRLAKKVAYWAVPLGVQEIIKDCFFHNRVVNSYEKIILKRNQRFRDIHNGQRCFILATGPSIRGQDLRPLRHEWCFGTSEFYKHPDYQTINPAYYCTAPFHPPFTDEVICKRLSELKDKAQNEIFFFALSDKKRKIWPEFINDPDKLFYLKFSRIDANRVPTVDLTTRLPRPQSVTNMAIYIALYMGFTEIYLLGCDHNSLWEWSDSSRQPVKHFYEGEPTIGYEPYDIDIMLEANLRLRYIYRWVAQIARKKNTHIFNTSLKSYIDIFPKVDLKFVLDKK